MKMGLLEIQDRYKKLGLGDIPATAMNAALQQAGFIPVGTETGRRTTTENSLRYLYQQMYVDPALMASIQDIRKMDRLDGRVKKIHNKVTRTAVKGGLKIIMTKGNKTLERRWMEFSRRLSLHRHEKLESDARALVMEGNLPLQWVLNASNQVAGAVRMPTETIRPNVGENGRFKDPASAYEQIDVASGRRIGDPFPLWRLTLARLAPDNFDDMGSMGRPYLDASRPIWKKLCMTEEDLVIRRRERAPMRTAHVLEGAGKEDLEAYKKEVEDEQKEITTNYYLNKKGGVTAVQGDANLDQIKDVVLMLDAFFAGAPAPKGLFGYVDDLSRDILEDLKRDYYEEIDALQDTQAFAYEVGFRLDLLLAGINPDNFDFEIQFAERKTETPNQAADRALKQQALGASKRTCFETAGLDYTQEVERLDDEAEDFNPYPTGQESAHGPRKTNVNITPGNARKGDSATTISSRSGGR